MHVIFLPLGRGLFTQVDSDCPEEIWRGNWFATKGRVAYAARNIPKSGGGQMHQIMHRLLMPGIERVDHKNGDGLNNLRRNLRPATRCQNQQGFQSKRAGTSSKYRGVHWHKSAQKWYAGIRVSGKQLFLGLFQSEADAARAYDNAARKYFGEFASPNFPL